MIEMKIVQYSEDLGKFTMPEGAEELLRGLPIEEQMAFFSIMVTSNKVADHKCSLRGTSDVKALIVNDGIIIGVMMSNDYGMQCPCYIGESVCTWDSSDNNGAGYKSRTEYSKLLFVPKTAE